MINLIRKHQFYTTKSPNSYKKLNKKEIEKFEQFLTWLEKYSDKITYFYRGTEKSKLRERIKVKYQVESNNHIMNYLFEFGEKSKSYTTVVDGNIKEINDFLTHVSDINDITFEYIFNKITEILNKESKHVLKFRNSNPSFLSYFSEDNLTDFISKINKLESSDKLKVRDYYLRFIHSIYELGEKNMYSVFVSTTQLRVEAEGFKSNKTDNILILYWLPKPISRFGIDIGIINQMSILISNNELPAYYSEFFPKVGEFSLKGALLKEHIIGYLFKDKIIISPRLLTYPKFDKDTIENGLYYDDAASQAIRLKEKSTYARQFLLADNLLYHDREI